MPLDDVSCVCLTAHVLTIALLGVVVTIGGCATPIRVENTSAVGVMIVTQRTVAGANAVFTSAPFTVPPRSLLPRIVLPLSREGSTLHAGGSGGTKWNAVVLVLEESPFWRDVTAVEVSRPLEIVSGLGNSVAQSLPPERAPCSAASAFFIKGVGKTPPEPILLTKVQGQMRGMTVVDPRVHTLNLERVMRVPAPPLVPEQHELLTSIELATGGHDFFVIALIRRDGYTAMSFHSSVRRYAWPNLPDDGETSIYVLNDNAGSSPCATGRL